MLRPAEPPLKRHLDTVCARVINMPQVFSRSSDAEALDWRPARIRSTQHGQAARMRWARLLKRVFAIDVERCDCGGQLKILAAIEEPVLIVRILTHLGLTAREFSLDYVA